MVTFLEHFTKEFVVPQKILICNNQQLLSFLMAGKCVGENVTFSQLNHVNIEFRGGLWEVNESFTYIFKFVERCFRIAPEKDVVKIDPKSVASNWLMLLFDIMLRH